MFNKLTVTKLTVLTLTTIAVTFLLIGIVIFDDPPAFFGYFFGFLSGANWILLYVLYRDYWEGF